MFQRGRRLLVLAAVWWVGTLCVHAGGWPQERSDLAPTPAAQFGTMPNGMRYVVQRNAEPRGRISLRLLVLAGSLHERDDERGLAHFVEHMAFSSTRRFPHNTLVDVLQQHGLAFGADVSAFTFLTHTIYQLDVPADPTARLDEGLAVLRDFADGQLFDPAEIDRERGVIESERRARDSWGARGAQDRDRFLYPLSLVSRRWPIGDEAIIAHAGPAELRGFYERWYRADNVIVIAVGDLAPDQLVARITAAFDTMARPATPPPPAPDLGSFGNPSEVTSAYHSEPAAGATSLDLCSVVAGPGGAETLAVRRASLEREIVLTMLNERLNQLRRDHAKDFGAASTWSAGFGQHYGVSALHLDCSALVWQSAIGELARAWHLAHESGFSAEEIAGAVRLLHRRYDFAVAAESTDWSRNVADRFVFALAEDRVTSSAAQWRDLANDVLDHFTPERSREVFRALWPGAPRLFGLGNVTGADLPATMTAAYNAAAAGPVPPLPHPTPAALDYQPAATPGAIKHRSHVADLDLDLVEFANGVRLNLKRTEFNRNVVYLRARVGDGRLGEPLRLPGLTLLAVPYVNDAGLGRQDNADIQRFVAERNLSLAFGVEENAFTFTGGSDTATTDDLLLLLTAYLSDPAWRPKEFASAQGHIVSSYQDVAHEVSSGLQLTAQRVITREDPRFVLPPYPQTAARTLGELMTWIESNLKLGSVEVGLVGDFDVEATIAFAARTLGSLPPRPVRVEPARSIKPVVFSTAPGRWQTSVDSAIPRGSVRVQWPVRGCSDIHHRRRLEALGDILQERVRHEIREKLGATYDPDATVWSGDTLRDDGYLMVGLSTKPEDAARIAQRIVDIADDVARHGVNDTEFEAVRQPRLAENPTKLRDNGYWLYYVVASAQSEPARLDWPRSRKPDLLALTPREISREAKSFLRAKHAQVFTALPAAK